jgi:hypothetical protein
MAIFFFFSNSQKALCCIRQGFYLSRQRAKFRKNKNYWVYVCINFFCSPKYERKLCSMLELNGKPSSATSFSTDFSFQNLVFGIYLNFSSRNQLKNQYLALWESRSYQINSIKSCSSRAFQQCQWHIPIPQKFPATN